MDPLKALAEKLKLPNAVLRAQTRKQILKLAKNLSSAEASQDLQSLLVRSLTPPNASSRHSALVVDTSQLLLDLTDFILNPNSVLEDITLSVSVHLSTYPETYSIALPDLLPIIARLFLRSTSDETAILSLLQSLVSVEDYSGAVVSLVERLVSEESRWSRVEKIITSVLFAAEFSSVSADVFLSLLRCESQLLPRVLEALLRMLPFVFCDMRRSVGAFPVRSVISQLILQQTSLIAAIEKQKNQLLMHSLYNSLCGIYIELATNGRLLEGLSSLILRVKERLGPEASNTCELMFGLAFSMFKMSFLGSRRALEDCLFLTNALLANSANRNALSPACRSSLTFVCIDLKSTSSKDASALIDSILSTVCSAQPTKTFKSFRSKFPAWNYCSALYGTVHRAYVSEEVSFEKCVAALAEFKGEVPYATYMLWGTLLFHDSARVQLALLPLTKALVTQSPHTSFNYLSVLLHRIQSERNPEVLLELLWCLPGLGGQQSVYCLLLFHSLSSCLEGRATFPLKLRLAVELWKIHSFHVWDRVRALIQTADPDIYEELVAQMCCVADVCALNGDCGVELFSEIVHAIGYRGEGKRCVQRLGISSITRLVENEALSFSVVYARLFSDSSTFRGLWEEYLLFIRLGTLFLDFEAVDDREMSLEILEQALRLRDHPAGANVWVLLWQVVAEYVAKLRGFDEFYRFSDAYDISQLVAAFIERCPTSECVVSLQPLVDVYLREEAESRPKTVSGSALAAFDCRVYIPKLVGTTAIRPLVQSAYEIARMRLSRYGSSSIQRLLAECSICWWIPFFLDCFGTHFGAASGNKEFLETLKLDATWKANPENIAANDFLIRCAASLKSSSRAKEQTWSELYEVVVRINESAPSSANFPALLIAFGRVTSAHRTISNLELKSSVRFLVELERPLRETAHSTSFRRLRSVMGCKFLALGDIARSFAADLRHVASSEKQSFARAKFDTTRLDLVHSVFDFLVASLCESLGLQVNGSLFGEKFSFSSSRSVRCKDLDVLTGCTCAIVMCLEPIHVLRDSLCLENLSGLTRLLLENSSLVFKDTVYQQLLYIRCSLLAYMVRSGETPVEDAFVFIKEQQLQLWDNWSHRSVGEAFHSLGGLYNVVLKQAGHDQELRASACDFTCKCIEVIQGKAFADEVKLGCVLGAADVIGFNATLRVSIFRGFPEVFLVSADLLEVTHTYVRTLRRLIYSGNSASANVLYGAILVFSDIIAEPAYAMKTGSGAKQSSPGQILSVPCPEVLSAVSSAIDSNLSTWQSSSVASGAMRLLAQALQTKSSVVVASPVLCRLLPDLEHATSESQLGYLALMQAQCLCDHSIIRLYVSLLESPVFDLLAKEVRSAYVQGLSALIPFATGEASRIVTSLCAKYCAEVGGVLLQSVGDVLSAISDREARRSSLLAVSAHILTPDCELARLRFIVECLCAFRDTFNAEKSETNELFESMLLSCKEARRDLELRCLWSLIFDCPLRLTHCTGFLSKERRLDMIKVSLVAESIAHSATNAAARVRWVIDLLDVSGVSENPAIALAVLTRLIRLLSGPELVDFGDREGFETLPAELRIVLLGMDDMTVDVFYRKWKALREQLRDRGTSVDLDALYENGVLAVIHNAKAAQAIEGIWQSLFQPLVTH